MVLHKHSYAVGDGSIAMIRACGTFLAASEAVNPMLAPTSTIVFASFLMAESTASHNRFSYTRPADCSKY